MVGKWWMWLLAAVLTVGSAQPAIAHTGHTGLAARGCVRGPWAPAAYLSASGPEGYKVAVGGLACEFIALEAGGFAAVAGDFAVEVIRDGVTHRYDERDGRCADDVIAVGDRVRLSASIAAQAGADSGCGA